MERLIWVGTGLAGLIAVKAGASQVVISDYPNTELLASLNANVENNIPEDLRGRVSVQGHEWGQVEDAFSAAHASHFTRILSADCLWMPGEHLSLVQSMLHFLAYREHAQVWVTAGFHTGRPTIAQFFTVAATAGLKVQIIWERDVYGNVRPWSETRDEDITARKKWLVVAILRRRNDPSAQHLIHRWYFDEQ